MKIGIECASALDAKKLKTQIVKDMTNKGLITWEHTTTQSGVDVVFHNPLGTVFA